MNRFLDPWPRRYALLMASAVSLGGMAPIHAALVVESRPTQLQAATQWGFLGGVITEQHEFTSTSLTEDLQARLGAGRQGEGALGDGSWIANFNFQMDQQLEFRANGFTVSGSTDLFAFAGDQGVSVVDARPGNRLELGFSVSVPEAFTVTGQTTDFCSLSLEKNVGPGTWMPLVGPSSGTLFTQLNLDPGQYRIMAEGSGYHDGSTGMGSAWTLSVQSVPEPSHYALLGAGMLAIAGARRRFRGH